MPKISAQKKLENAFKNAKVMDLNDLREVIQSNSRMTIFRRLEKIGYYSSYSHVGRYYTLKEIPRFDSDGIWFLRDIGFSKNGSLKNTIKSLVDESEAGKFHAELEDRLKVRAQNALLELARIKKIDRVKYAGKYLYLSAEPGIGERQLRRRDKIATLVPAKSSGFSETMEIEILAETIRQSSKCPTIKNVFLGLCERGLSVTEKEITTVFERHDIEKKTLDLR
jgi:ribosomal protein S8